MALTNMFEAETLICEKLEVIFNKDMIFIEVDLEALSNETFIDKDTDSEKIGVLILNAGFRTDPLVGNSRSPQQRLKTLWQVVVVCPKDLYKLHGGVKMIEVINLLKGWRVSAEIDKMQLIDDERGFNRPDYNNDLAYLPMMFTVNTIV